MAVLSAQTFFQVFGEETTSRLVITLQQSLEPNSIRPPLASADNRHERVFGHPRRCPADSCIRWTGKQEPSNQMVHIADSQVTASSRSSVGIDHLKSDDHTSARPHAHAIPDQENMQYFFILARGTRRIICAPTRELNTALTGRPNEQYRWPTRRRRPRRPQNQQACQHMHVACNRRSVIAPSNGARPLTAAPRVQGCAPFYQCMPAERKAPPRSAILMQNMSSQISGPISVSQVLHGDLTSTYMHDEVEEDCGVPPPPQSTDLASLQSPATFGACLRPLNGIFCVLS